MLIILPQFPKMEKASPEQVDLAHKQYMAALAALYLKHNTDENVSLVINWKYSTIPWIFVIAKLNKRGHLQILDSILQSSFGL